MLDNSKQIKQYIFAVNMSYADFLPYYQGQVHTIVVTSTTGERVQFPAMNIRQYLTPTGIQGYFCMNTKNNKFLSLNKLS